MTERLRLRPVPQDRVHVTVERWGAQDINPFKVWGPSKVGLATFLGGFHVHRTAMTVAQDIAALNRLKVRR